MTLVQFDTVSIEFGVQALLKEASFALEPNERVCLIGRNGAGKTTMLKLITGELEPDSGEIQRRSGIGISQLAQTLPDAEGQTVRDMVASGLDALQALAEDYRRRSAESLDRQGLRELEALHQQIDAHGGWNIDQSVDTIISELKLPAERKIGELSGGWRRRVALARALVSKPDLLLLDEPTNHLDLATITWLEQQVFNYPGSVLFITHDRAFLQRLATRIVELDRGQLTSWPGDYQNFLRRIEQVLADEDARNARFDKKLAQEEIWIRQGIKARRTRNEGRTRALMKMRGEREKRVAREASARISIGESERSGRKVLQARNITHGYGGETLIRNFSFKLMRGDRIGLIGNNGVGKSTLLRILLGEIEPDTGTVKQGTNLEIGYFDQLRQALDLDKSVADNVSGGSDYVTINGKKQHIVGYLRGFLFSAKRAMTPVRALSGGERNRIILAKLFTRPTNLLVLDEPTNDLDVQTLEVLEQRVTEYAGTLIVVSHDREFLDHVVTSLLVFEEDGGLREYVGGYSDWLRSGHALVEKDKPGGAAGDSATARPKKTRAAKKQKLSYLEQRELDQLPAQIQALEQEIEGLQQQVSAQDFYSQPFENYQPILDELEAKSAGLGKMTERWIELEEIRERLDSGKR